MGVIVKDIHSLVLLYTIHIVAALSSLLSKPGRAVVPVVTIKQTVYLSEVSGIGLVIE